MQVCLSLYDLLVDTSGFRVKKWMKTWSISLLFYGIDHLVRTQHFRKNCAFPKNRKVHLYFIWTLSIVRLHALNTEKINWMANELAGQ